MTKKVSANEEMNGEKKQVAEERGQNGVGRAGAPGSAQKKKRSILFAIVAGVIVAVAFFAIMRSQNSQLQTVDLGNTVIQDFITEYASPLEGIAQPMLDRMGAGSSVVVEPGTGNEVVYVLRYGSEIATEELAVESEAALDAFSSKLSGLAHEIQHMLYTNELWITVNYLSYEGDLLATRRFGGLHGH